MADREREPLRRRDGLMAVLLLALAAYSIVSGQMLRAEQQRQQACITAYVTVNSETSVIRSQLVERESRAVRLIITDVFAASTPADGRRAYRNYVKRLSRIDAARAAHPIQQFSDDRCEKYR
jgi:hypothetical protein